MQEAKAAWEDVGSQFSSLGLKLKEHFAQAASNETDSGSERSDTAARDAMRDAMRKLGAALDDAVEAVSGAAKDPAITDDLRKVGQSVMNAFHSTFADVSDDLRQAFSRSRTEQD
ncbi:MAG TPA: hypothetical protein VM282_02995 [Acidimicrobiales bacterium]|nr:hypothetical protein [Acidimicrobiales bacterium]